MEYAVSCEICSLEYCQPETVPRMLDCGHSFCTSCITLLENALCPKCRVNIPCGKEFPVNYSLLSIIEEFKSQKSLSDDMVSIQNLKGKLNSKLSIFNKMFEICSEKEAIETDLSLLTFMEKGVLNEEHGSKEMMRNELRKLEEKYEEFPLVNYLKVDNLEEFSSFSLKKNPSHHYFLKEIYEAVKNSDKVFAFKHIDEKLKFGELTVRDNKLMIHSLTLSQVPKGSKLVQFNNLRKVFQTKPLHTFLEITTATGTSHTIIIKLSDTSLAPHFIKLSTAEKGPTYKNLRIDRGSNKPVYEDHGHGMSKITTLVTILQAHTPAGLLFDYYKNNPSSVPCVEDDVIVTDTTNGGFHIFRVKKSNKYSILGKVIYPPDLWNHSPSPYEQNFFLDCGLVTDV